jgi:hypothetical protein
MPAAARAEREDDRGGRCGHRREGGTETYVAPSRAARRERARGELGRQPGIEARANALGQRLLAEAGELAAHGLQLVVRHLPLEGRVIHVR